MTTRQTELAEDGEAALALLRESLADKPNITASQKRRRLCDWLDRLWSMEAWVRRGMEAQCLLASMPCGHPAACMRGGGPGEGDPYCGWCAAEAELRQALAAYDEARREAETREG
jgi:hypothetical protein